MTNYEFSSLKIGRLERDGPNYELYGLPEGEDFRDEDSYTRLTAVWLKVNGVAFSCDGAEFGEHEHTITVEQDIEGGAAHINL